MATVARPLPLAHAQVAYRRILVPVGGGRGWSAGVTIACGLAVEQGGSVCVLVVIEVPAALPLDAHMPVEEAEARDILAAAEAIGDERGVRIEWRVARARVAGEAVIDAAEELDAELIVLQVRERRRPFLRKTGRYVLQHARCRVLLCAPRP